MGLITMPSSLSMNPYFNLNLTVFILNYKSKHLRTFPSCFVNNVWVESKVGCFRWRYAYNSVLSRGITRKINQWKWSHIQAHINRVKQYKQEYKLKLAEKDISSVVSVRWSQKLRFAS